MPVPKRAKFSPTTWTVWALLTFVSGLLAIRILWDIYMPWGFWRIPAIRMVYADQIAGPSSKIDFTARLAGPGIPNRWLRIPLEEAHKVRPGYPVLFMDCYYLADNQPNMHRVTLWRIIKGYPELWFVVLLLVIIHRRKRRTSFKDQPTSTK